MVHVMIMEMGLGLKMGVVCRVLVVVVVVVVGLASIIQLIYAVGQCLVFTLCGFRFCLFAYKSFCIIYA